MVDNLGVPIAVTVVLIVVALAVWLIRYQFGLQRVTADLVAAEEALDSGDVERARALTAPLLDRFPRLAIVQEVAADVLYAGGDPLSAASLWERAQKKLGAARVAPRLVAAYAALNRAGDARRVAAAVPNDTVARITLAWSELVAVGGDHDKGRRLAEELERDMTVRGTPSGEAMVSALIAITAARAGELVRMRDALKRVDARGDELSAHDRAFVGYLVGVAQREAGAITVARDTWTAAMDVAPESIGAALARRERSHLPAS